MNYNDYGELLVSIGKNISEDNNNNIILDDKYTLQSILFNKLIIINKAIYLLEKNRPPELLIEEHNELVKNFSFLSGILKKGILHLDFNQIIKEIRYISKQIQKISQNILSKIIHEIS